MPSPVLYSQFSNVLLVFYCTLCVDIVLSHHSFVPYYSVYYCTAQMSFVPLLLYSVIKLYNKNNASEHCILHALFITGRHIFHSTRNLYILYRYCGSGRLFTDRNSLVWAGHLVLHKNKVFIL